MIVFLKHQTYCLSRKLVVLFTFSALFASAQITIGFQGGEPGDSWGYTSTGASALALAQATMAENKVTGTQSLVVGGNTGGGNCFDTGSGNGPATPRTFTFNALDISSSSNYVRTLTFHWGNRFPACSGTGWDSGENLVFRAYHDGVAQAPVTLATGSNNAQFSIHFNQHTWSIPACVTSFSFVVSITTNRADELLFLDDVRVTTPELNGSLTQPQFAVTNPTACEGTTGTYSVVQENGVVYTWSGLPAGASFVSPNGTVNSHTMTINWGTVPPGSYTITVTPSTACGGPGTPATTTITITPPPVYTISGPTEMCAGESVTLTSSAASGNTWTPGGQTSQSITATNPGTYSVAITSPSCGVQTVSHTIALKPDPVITSVDHTNSTCFGENDGTITIHTAQTDLEFSMDGTAYGAGNSFTGLSAGTYQLWVRQTGGCTIELPSVQISEPEELIAQASNTGAYCAGEQLLLQGTSSGTSTPVYNWTGPAGYTSSVQNPTDATAAGNYTLTVTANGCSSEIASTTVIVHALPTAVASNAGPYCVGDVIQLTGTTTNPAGATYQWTGPNGFTSSVQNPQGILAAGAYQLIVTENGCNSAPSATNVVIHEIPVAQAAYLTPFCPGTPLQLVGNATPAAGASYQWAGPNGYTSTVQSPTDATEVGNYVLLVSVNGCTSTPATVNVVPDVPVLNVSNTGPYCEGETIHLAAATPSAGAITWSWEGPAGYISSVQNPSDAVTAGTYTLTINVNNCVSVATTNVVIHPNPVAIFTATTPCLNDATVFSSDGTHVASPGVISEWHWDFGDGISAYTDNPIYSYQNPGTFDVTLSVRTSTNCTASYTQSITIVEPPYADFHFAPETPMTINPLVNFTNTSEHAVSYLWDFGYMGHTSEMHSPSFTYPENGVSYVVTLIAYNEAGCTDTVRKPIGITEEMIYYIPNAFTPDGDEFNQYFTPVFTSGIDPTSYFLAVYNRWGELIFESRDVAIGWDGTYRGEVVPTGMYTWNIRIKHKYSDAHEDIVGHVSLLR